jgi:hypothetical protein
MKSQLSGPEERTYQRVFEYPTPHDIPLEEVWAMLGAIADVRAVEEKGNLTASRNGQTLVLHRGRGKQMAAKKELMHVRHFLERSGTVGAHMSGGSR